MPGTMETACFLGETAVALAGGGYRATLVPQRGGCLISLRHEETGAQLLRTPDSREAWDDPKAFFGIPLLFPPNRIAGGTFERHGLRYRMPLNSNDGKHYIHGILRSQPWMLTDASREAAAMRLEPMYAYFPHECAFSVRYALSEAGLSQEVSCVNRGPRPMPFGFGQHTALAVPFLPGSTPEDLRLRLPIQGRWALDEDMVPTQELLPLTAEEQAFTAQGLPPLGKAYATTHFLLARAEPGSPREVVLRDARAGLEVAYALDEAYPHLVLWNHGAKHGYVCPEPMTWMIDAPNRTLPDAMTGYRALEPGESVTLTTRLSLRHAIA
ncbi:MAG TPA: aldose 1-epimerase [Clostridia bacterium]|nr:aldose 1-epimerase [Clostridia bacterium]